NTAFALAVWAAFGGASAGRRAKNARTRHHFGFISTAIGAGGTLPGKIVKTMNKNCSVITIGLFQKIKNDSYLYAQPQT
uniref:hypothetical protein n=1 Tax=Flavobacterium sp. TaxID=239 RepID=UPI00260A38AF